MLDEVVGMHQPCHVHLLVLELYLWEGIIKIIKPEGDVLHLLGEPGEAGDSPDSPKM